MKELFCLLLLFPIAIIAQNSIDFSNTERSHHSNIDGLVYYDANFYPDYPEFSVDGGGLSIYTTEDGWGAIFSTNNMRWLTPTFDGGVFNNNVGIGTDSPLSELSVIGEIGWGDNFEGSSLRQVNALRETVMSANMRLAFIADQVNTLDSDKRIIFGAGDTTTDGASFVEYMRIDRGNVGIGTTNPGSWKLAVNGKLRAKEIKVEASWSDFVFEEDYDLPTLEEVEKHIQEKGHLKDMPSEEEVEKEGIHLGAMNAKLLQKIEELTLYVIELKKENKEQQKLIEEQFMFLAKLEKRLSQN